LVVQTTEVVYFVHKNVQVEISVNLQDRKMLKSKIRKRKLMKKTATRGQVCRNVSRG